MADSTQSDMPRARISRRRYVLVAGIILAVLITVPMALMANSDYLGRFDSLRAQHEPWAQSTHFGEATCAQCHVSPAPVSQARYRFRSVGAFYTSLVSGKFPKGYFAKPRNAACLTCHEDLKTVSPKGDLKIPHRAHVEILKMECVACHNYLVHEKSPEGKHVPPMSGCMTCHDGDKAKDSCTACHTDKAAPASHQSPEWAIVHAEKAKDPECDSCHEWTENWCVDCHNRPPKSHAVGWREAHQVYVAKHRNCEACHEAPLCVRCHGEVPRLNYDPSLELVR